MQADIGPSENERKVENDRKAPDFGQRQGEPIV
jgi:hypothetical protein